MSNYTSVNCGEMFLDNGYKITVTQQAHGQRIDFTTDEDCPGCKAKDAEIERLTRLRDEVEREWIVARGECRASDDEAMEKDVEIERLKKQLAAEREKNVYGIDWSTCEGHVTNANLDHLVKLFERREVRDVATEKRNVEIASSNAGAIHMLEQMADAIDHISDELDKWEPAK